MMNLRLNFQGEIAEMTSLEQALEAINYRRNNEAFQGNLNCNFILEVFNDKTFKWQEWVDEQGYTVNSYTLYKGKAVKNY